MNRSQVPTLWTSKFRYTFRSIVEQFLQFQNTKSLKTLLRIDDFTFNIEYYFNIFWMKKTKAVILNENGKYYGRESYSGPHEYEVLITQSWGRVHEEGRKQSVGGQHLE